MSGSTSTVSIIPLVPSAQTLSISLNGNVYNLRLMWNTPSQTWTLDIADVNQNPVISGIPLVPGEDVLGQYEYLDIGGQMFIQNTTDPEAYPTFKDLGQQSLLYFETVT